LGSVAIGGKPHDSDAERQGRGYLRVAPS